MLGEECSQVYGQYESVGENITELPFRIIMAFSHSLVAAITRCFDFF